MIRRIWKEFVPLRFYWIVLFLMQAALFVAMAAGIRSALARTVVDFFRTWLPKGIYALLLAQWLSFHLMGASVFGGEFSHRTMGRLLAQPISRNRIWFEKVAALLSAMILVHIGNLLLLLRWRDYYLPRLGMPFGRAVETLLLEFKQDIASPWMALSVSITLFALASGPLMALLLRQTHTAFWASLVAPLVGLLLIVLTENTLSWLFGFSIFDILLRALPVLAGCNFRVLFALLWFAVFFPLGWLKFKRLEV